MNKILTIVFIAMALLFSFCKKDEISEIKVFSGDLILLDQNSVDEFGKQAYEIVNGNVIIDRGSIGPIIRNLNGLAKLDTINGNLQIYSTLIENVDGLSKLKYISGDLTISRNYYLENINGLKSLEYVGEDIAISSNPNLTSINELSGITIANGIYIGGNEKLVNLFGLHNISQNNGDLWITSNSSLVDLKWLISLERVEKDVFITNNPLIKNLNGLSSLVFVGGFLRIDADDNLKDFCGIRNLLMNDGVVGQISGFPVYEVINGQCDYIIW